MSRWPLPRYFAIQEGAHERTDLWRFVLEREVAGVNRVELRFGMIIEDVVNYLAWEDLVVDAGDDQRRRTPLAKESLHGLKSGDVVADVVQHVEHDLV